MPGQPHIPASQAICRLVPKGGIKSARQLKDQLRYLTKEKDYRDAEGRDRTDKRELIGPKRYQYQPIPRSDIGELVSNWVSGNGYAAPSQDTDETPSDLTCHLILSFPPKLGFPQEFSVPEDELIRRVEEATKLWTEAVFESETYGGKFDYVRVLHMNRPHPHVHLLVNRRAHGQHGPLLRISREPRGLYASRRDDGFSQPSLDRSWLRPGQISYEWLRREAANAAGRVGIQLDAMLYLHGHENAEPLAGWKRKASESINKRDPGVSVELHEQRGPVELPKPKRPHFAADPSIAIAEASGSAGPQAESPSGLRSDRLLDTRGVQDGDRLSTPLPDADADMLRISSDDPSGTPSNVSHPVSTAERKKFRRSSRAVEDGVGQGGGRLRDAAGLERSRASGDVSERYTDAVQPLHPKRRATSQLLDKGRLPKRARGLRRDPAETDLFSRSQDDPALSGEQTGGGPHSPGSGPEASGSHLALVDNQGETERTETSELPNTTGQEGDGDSAADIAGEIGAADVPNDARPQRRQRRENIRPITRSITTREHRSGSSYQRPPGDDPSPGNRGRSSRDRGR